MFASKRAYALSRATLVLLLAATAGCATSNGARRKATPTSQSETKIRVVVENNAVLDMNIYASPEAGGRYRIGTVSAKSTSAFWVRTTLLGSVSFRLIGDPVGSREMRYSDLMPVDPGMTAVWRIGVISAISSSEYYYNR